MIIVEEEDIVIFEHINSLIFATPSDSLLAKNLCEKYKMENCISCSSCPEITRRLFSKIKDYYKINKIEDEK